MEKIYNVWRRHASSSIKDLYRSHKSLEGAKKTIEDIFSSGKYSYYTSIVPGSNYLKCVAIGEYIYSISEQELKE